MPYPKGHQGTGRKDSFRPLSLVRCMPVRHIEILCSSHVACQYSLTAHSFTVNSLHLFFCFCSVLFQMALIPFTMSRYTIATFSDSRLNKYLPLDKALRIHIHLGYTMVSIVFSATIVFFIFFGLSCSEGEEAFCAKFTSEIMITGYCILGLLVSLGRVSCTSFFPSLDDSHLFPFLFLHTI